MPRDRRANLSQVILIVNVDLGEPSGHRRPEIAHLFDAAGHGARPLRRQPIRRDDPRKETGVDVSAGADDGDCLARDVDLG
jgi:hypothetical protein